MKKTLYILFAAAIAMATAACTKEDPIQSGANQKTVRTFTCSFDDSGVTKTDITKQGKTVWADGDKLWISNGTAFDTLTVASEYAGQKYCEFQTTLEGTLYVVYPLSAAKGVSDGKFQIDIPSIQNGTFGSANIAVAVAEDRYVKMKNVTSVLQFRIPADAKPIKAVSANAVDNAVAGTCMVDMSTGTPVVTTGETTASDVIVKTDGLSGKFYMSVIPGTYNSGFTLTAVSTDLNNACESKTTVSAKTLKANDLFDLGSIGSNLKALSGDGSEASPWLIGSYPEILAFTYYVNEGNSMRGEFVKVTNDIKGITAPIGKYDTENSVYIPFKGSFDGGGKTLTVAIKQDADNAAGLFANLGDSASVSNLTIAGSVASDYAAGALAGYAGSSSTMKISNCKSKAIVSGIDNVGGLIGKAENYSDANKTSISIDNCSNEAAIESDGCYHGGLAGSCDASIFSKCSNSGSVNGKYDVGGLVGSAYLCSFNDCSNSASVTASESAGRFMIRSGSYYVCDYMGGAAGIAGYSQNASFKKCSNTGAISGVNKCGGIAGTLYWGAIVSSDNSGSVDVSEDAAGGIVGWNITQGRIYGCTNKGDITTKRYQAGGIAGQVQPYHSGSSSAANMYYQNCRNDGKVTVTDGNAAGGIVGYVWIMNNVVKLTVDGCVNSADAEVIAPSYAGGIVGCEGRYSNWSRLDILNSENHGTVNGGSSIGGIFGGMLSYTRSQGVFIYNCYNSGNIKYADATSTNPKAGGIAGFINNGGNGRIQNNYNSGLVSSEDGTVADGATIGAIVGYSNTATVIGESYYLDGTCPQALGPGSKTSTANNLVAVNSDGSLTAPVTINSVTFNTLIEVLNAWRNGNKAYLKWKAGPGFIYPVDSDPIDGGDFDLGNGGQI
jgi:hypothetical protein